MSLPESLPKQATVNTLLDRVNNWANEHQGLLTLAAFLVAALGLGARLFALVLPLGPRLSSLVARFAPLFFWAGALSLIIILSFVWRQNSQRLAYLEDRLQILESLPEILLDETTAANLSNWSFGHDRWTLDEHGLSVTRSPFGGVCKIGASWENYEFAFEFRIMHHCAAWIVRASATRPLPSRYVMVQCTEEKVRPHVFFARRGSEDEVELAFQVLNEIPHQQSFHGWNKARTRVVGHSIMVWINDDLVWSDAELLKDHPTGTVGFRASGVEHALFRNIRVDKK